MYIIRALIVYNSRLFNIYSIKYAVSIYLSIYLFVYRKLHLNFWMLGIQPNFRESLLFTSLVTQVKNNNNNNNNNNKNIN